MLICLALTNLASPLIDDPTRYGDGSSLIHDASLRDYA
jgi:hypothetical protein